MMAPVIVEYENWLAGLPIPVQKALFKPLASLGGLLGYKARYPEYGDDPPDEPRAGGTKGGYKNSGEHEKGNMMTTRDEMHTTHSANGAANEDRKDPEMKQRQVLLTGLGGPEVLRVVERDVPEPGPGEVRVRVLASGIAFADVLMRHGKYPGVPKPPFTPGYDVVGEVEKPGAGVAGVEVGTRVAALTQIGGNAQSVVLSADELVSVPDGVDATEAASLTLNYVTAYQMLYRVAKVEPGERVLVHGAAGGVGTAMLQLGRLHGLEMYGTASAGKHELVSKLGATPIDYRAEDFVQRTLSLTGDGVDAVFDPIGGRHLARSWKTLRRGGRLVGYGMASTVGTGGLVTAGILAGTMGRVALRDALPNGKKADFYVILGFKKKHPEAFKEDLSLLLGLLAEGEIQPVVAERLPLEDAARAHGLMENAGVRGKIVLLPNG